MLGLGYGMLLVRFYVNVYYVIVCAWALFYMFVGFTSHLPWQDCGDLETNTVGCYSKRETERCDESDNSTLHTYYNSTCMTYSTFCSNFGYSSSSDTEEICYDLDQNPVKFSDLYKRYLIFATKLKY